MCDWTMSIISKTLGDLTETCENQISKELGVNAVHTTALSKKEIIRRAKLWLFQRIEKDGFRHFMGFRFAGIESNCGP